MKNIDKIITQLHERNPRGIARALTFVENGAEEADQILASLDTEFIAKAIIIGITGPPGVGKSTLTDELVAFYRKQGKRVGVIAVDPSSPLSGGAILGDRVRMMRHSLDPDVIVRSMATRGRLGGICSAAGGAVRILAGSGCDVVIIETVGVGQSEVDVVKLADMTIMVMAPGLGDDIQAMKAGILEVADVIAVNKADHPGADAMAMDMQTVLRERKHDIGQLDTVVMTIASEGKGVVELAAQIERYLAALQQNGGIDEKRKKARNLEMVDWAVEHIRGLLLRKVSETENTLNSNPKIQAKILLKSLLQEIDDSLDGK